MTHTTHAIDLAEEMSENLGELSIARLSWLVMNNPTFQNLTDFSPEALLLTELLRRLDGPLSQGFSATSFGWIHHGIGEVLDYRNSDSR